MMLLVRIIVTVKLTGLNSSCFVLHQTEDNEVA